METLKYFIDSSMHWDNWYRTEHHLNFTGFVVSPRTGGSVYYSESSVSANYRGFSDAYDVLSNLGCDSIFVTNVLKFCITHADGRDLGQFIVQPTILSRIEMANAIGLSGEELVVLLMSDRGVAVQTSLPDDLDWVSEL